MARVRDAVVPMPDRASPTGVDQEPDTSSGEGLYQAEAQDTPPSQNPAVSNPLPSAPRSQTPPKLYSSRAKISSGYQSKPAYVASKKVIITIEDKVPSKKPERENKDQAAKEPEQTAPEEWGFFKRRGLAMLLAAGETLEAIAQKTHMPLATLLANRPQPIEECKLARFSTEDIISVYGSALYLHYEDLHQAMISDSPLVEKLKASGLSHALKVNRADLNDYFLRVGYRNLRQG